MAISQGEEKVIKSVQDAQESANAQSSLNVVNFKEYFGPKIENLTEAINSASQGSSFLSKVIIVVTVVATIIAGLQWYSTNARSHDFSQFGDKQLQCILALTKNQSEAMIDAAIEICMRRYP